MTGFVEDLSKLSRAQKTALQIALDASILIVSFLGSMLFQLEGLGFVKQPIIWGVLFSSVFATLSAFWALGLYKIIVRFLTGKVFLVIFKGVVVAAISLYAAGLIFGARLPLSVSFIFAVFAFISIGGVRIAARTYLRNTNHATKLPVIIYGAGAAGLQLLNTLFHGQEFAPVALVDDDPSLENMSVAGLRVYLPATIPHLVKKTGTRVILLAIPSIERVRRQQIVNALEGLQLEIRMIPSMSDIIIGKAKISDVRTVSAEDLLGRDPVIPDNELLGKNVTGRSVMVSGAGGSIGSELCRSVLDQGPSVLVLYDISEFALYTIELELTATAKHLNYQTRIIPILGSVQNRDRLEASIKAFKVQTIYHAAAYKHVPLLEENMVEGIRNNVFGTLAISLAARKLGVENFILISTDKAVRPTNIMGASKRIAELICQAQAEKASPTVFSMVRFGNVLGSSGSVIPRFREQIMAGGPVTVTHKDINRYFMTIPEAAQLVIQAGALGQGGDVFLLDMGDPVRIMDLAFSIVNLYGLTAYVVDHPHQISPEKGDIPVCITGLRKGEKLYEELLIGENPKPTKHPRIMTASEISLPYEVLMPVLDRLLRACENSNLPEIIAIMHELPLDYVPLGTDISDLLWGADQGSEERQNVTINASEQA